MTDNPVALLQRAIEKNLNGDFRHVQLATVDTDDHPACRTIVFRHLDTDRETLYFITDLRSHKVAEIRRQPRVEACWYLPVSREQFRLRGNAEAIGESDDPALMQLRADIWDRISPETRRLFVSPAPGSEAGEAPVKPPPAPQAPPACFALLALRPDGVDHLDLGTEPHGRSLFEGTEGTWRVRRLNP